MLADAFPLEQVVFAKRIQGVSQADGGVTLSFEDGTQANHTVLIGADGIHSRVRAALFGDEYPRFTGVVSYRSVVPTERVRSVPEIEAFTKWWGPNPQSQIVTFPLNRGRDTFIFATTGQDSWHEESWTSGGDVAELRSHYRDFHPQARALLDACDSVLKSALYERDPLPHWTVGQVSLLGDACHPMLPFMAQGAGMAIEDGVVLARCLHSGVVDVHAALQRYERARHERTAKATPTGSMATTCGKKRCPPEPAVQGRQPPVRGGVPQRSSTSRSLLQPETQTIITRWAARSAAVSTESR